MNGGEDRGRLAEYVIAARRMHYGTVEQAIRAAGVNRATWVRVEAGENVRDDKLGAVEAALGWEAGDAWRIMAGGEPFSSSRPAPVGDLRARIEGAAIPEDTRQSMLDMLDGIVGLLDSFESAPATTRRGA